MDLDWANYIDKFMESMTSSNKAEKSNKDEIEYLKSIDDTLKKVLKSGKGMSLADAENQVPGGASNPLNFGSARRSGKGFMDEALDSFERTLVESIVGADFKKNLQSSIKRFAEDMGTDIEGLSTKLGQTLGRQVISKFKSTSIGKAAHEAASGYVKDLVSGAGTAYKTAKGVATGLGMAPAEAAMAGAAKAATFLGTSLVPAAAAVAGVVIALKTFGPAIEGATAIFKAYKSAAGREHDSRKKLVELETKRLSADIEAMARAPFDILNKGAQAWYDAWDSNLRTITATQGYSKTDLYNLMGSFSDRLRDQGFVDVISGADITSNLARILESGLSGAVAEEFAYIATTLNAAIPTQDFFSYAGTYASLAANAIKSGASQAEAIKYANTQIGAFANNVLYASRQLAGGFTTGLKDAQSLFDSAVQISQASRTGSPYQIAGVLTSVAAITGAIAPDLASSMTDAIVSAALGGNDSSIVALRSLAGINASNTEFLRKLAENPQSVFSELFKNLAKMQSMSDGAYMEVAEGLSSVFGISKDAFARVDFNYLAQAISKMNVNSNALSENIELLRSGQTTTTAEQLRMTQVNEYMIEEGLAYVMDNETARVIQQHMWDEQLAQKLMESTYAVELQGAGLVFLEGMRHTLENLMNFFMPLKWLGKKFTNIVGTKAEATAQKADIEQLLQLGKMGQGSELALYQLLTRGRELEGLADLNIVDMMGGSSAYQSKLKSRQNSIKGINATPAIIPSLRGLLGTALSGIVSDWDQKGAFTGDSGPEWRTPPRSRYSGLVGKGEAASIASTRTGPAIITLATSLSNTAASQAQANSRLNEMLSTMETAASEGMSYKDWVKGAGKYGISDWEVAMENAGLTEETIKGAFQSAEMYVEQQRQQKEKEEEKAAQAKRQQAEDEFWESMKTNNTAIVELATIGNGHLERILSKVETFHNAWVDYFVNHKAYNTALKDNYKAVLDVQNKEKQGTEDAVYALAEALTRNNVDLVDPAVQTNALLSQILKVLASIMTQNAANPAGVSLPNQLSGLALGITGSL